MVLKKTRLSLLLLFVLMIMSVNKPLSAKSVIYPEPLKKGDKIAILAPAGHVKRDHLDKSVKVLRKLGYEPVVYPTSYGHLYSYSGTPEQRWADVKEALTDPEIRAILCARGGYGLVHLLDSICALPLEKDPKWVIGFSDISAWHALMASRGIASIHASMTRELAKGMEDEENQILFNILENLEFPEYELTPDPRNHLGEAEGKIVGGNLAVLQNLINTPYDILKPGTILFIEDVEEPIYKIQRMLYQLKMSGILGGLKGIVIGQFTDYTPGEGYTKMEDMIADVLKDYPDIPVAFDAPIGHIRHNYPIVESSRATLKVTPQRVTLKMTK